MMMEREMEINLEFSVWFRVFKVDTHTMCKEKSHILRGYAFSFFQKA